MVGREYTGISDVAVTAIVRGREGFVSVIVSIEDGNEGAGERLEMKAGELEWKLRLSFMTLISCSLYLAVWHA